MFGEFLNIIFKSIKLDRSLYTDTKNFGELSVQLSDEKFLKNRFEIEDEVFISWNDERESLLE